MELTNIDLISRHYVQPREVFKNAVLSNAESIILIHNHVSGDPEPTEEDFRCTKGLLQAGKLLGIPVLDHIIIGNEERSVSMAERPEWDEIGR